VILASQPADTSACGRIVPRSGRGCAEDMNCAGLPAYRRRAAVCDLLHQTARPAAAPAPYRRPATRTTIGVAASHHSSRGAVRSTCTPGQASPHRCNRQRNRHRSTPRRQTHPTETGHTSGHDHLRPRRPHPRTSPAASAQPVTPKFTINDIAATHRVRYSSSSASRFADQSQSRLLTRPMTLEDVLGNN
jgi:hypothetical protein